MATYDELREKYRKRQYDNVVDIVTAGMSHADELALDLNLLDGLGDAAEVLEQISVTLPFAIIAVTEGGKVIMGKKSGVKGLKDAGARAAKSGVAIAAGAGAALVAGGFAAVPTAISVRLIVDRYRAKVLLGSRIDSRTESLRFLREKWDSKRHPGVICADAPAIVPTGAISLAGQN